MQLALCQMTVNRLTKAIRIMKQLWKNVRKRSAVSKIIECRRTSVARMIVTLVLALALLACRDKLHIEKIAEPEYPLRARYEKLQGTVTVRVEIGPDGKVTFAEGSGAPEVLVKAAEENARQWVFGPFPAVNEFPIHHTIQENPNEANTNHHCTICDFVPFVDIRTASEGC